MRLSYALTTIRQSLTTSQRLILTASESFCAQTKFLVMNVVTVVKMYIN